MADTFSPTTESYGEIQEAYNFYNAKLFGGELPPCMITFVRIDRSYGYHAGKRWVNANGSATDELALNPSYFGKRTHAETLSTLVHEMCHIWQDKFGTPGRGRYHNREWAEKMKSVGLSPFNINNPSRETGDQVSHKIVNGELFDIATKELLTGWTLSWVERIIAGTPNSTETPSISAEQGADAANLKPSGPKRSGGQRVKYSCPNGHYSVWGRTGIDPVCGTCMARLDPDD